MGNKASTGGGAAPEEDEVALAATEEDIREDEEQAPTLNLTAAEDSKLRKQVTSCLKSMKKNPSSATKQRKALGKLRLYCNASSAYSKRSMDHILQQDGHVLIESAMKLHRKIATIQNHACRIMALLARAAPEATITAVPLLLEAMKAHKRNANLQCNALSALCFWGMAKPEQGGSALATLVVEKGAYPVIFQLILGAHETNAIVQDKALKTLVILTQSEKENRTAFVSAQAWKALANSLKHFNNKPKVLLKVLKIFRYVAMDHPSPVYKRLSVVLTIMKSNPDDAAIQRTGCATLLLLATNHPVSHEQLMEPGGGRDAILAAMQQHSSNEEIQKSAILCLQKLPNPDNDPNAPTNDQPGASPIKDTADAVTQGLGAMISTLQKENTTPQTCTNICKALVKLALESHTNKLDIASANGVEAILQAMKRFPQEQSLQRYACQALGQLACVEATKRAIVQESKGLGLQVLSQAIVSYPSQYLVTLHGIMVLLRLSQVMDNHKALLEAPIVPPLVQAMQQHPTQHIIQHKAMLILNKLATRSIRVKYPMVLSGCLQVILQAMKQHPTEIPIQKIGCLCLLNLHHKTTTIAVVQAGSLETIVATLHRHGDRIGLQVIGWRTIVEITQFTSHLKYWGNVGGLPCLMETLRKFPDHPVLHELAFGIFLQVSQTKSLHQPLVAAGGISMVMQGMKIHHPMHPCIQQVGFKTLFHLSRQSLYHSAIIFRKGGWRVIHHAKMACPDDPVLQKYAWTFMIQLGVFFLLHWMRWVCAHVPTMGMV